VPFLKIEDGVNLYYEDKGNGTPVLFIHGVWMSNKFFQKQIPYFSKEYRAISLDLRGHGRSSHIQRGHTISNYAKDVKIFMEKLELKDAVLVGWSMGAFVVWEYLKQFGTEGIKGTVIVDEMASDFNWPDFPIGAFDFQALTSIMRQVQEDRTGFLSGFIPLMFKDDLNKESLDWMLEETTRLPESIASAILFDQSVVDYRDFFPNIASPTLLCFGRAEKLIPVAAGEHLQQNIKNSKLVIFEHSCHCPFWEEPDLFNETVDRFIKSLSCFDENSSRNSFI
jgi:non-heme chloroperoxidase